MTDYDNLDDNTLREMSRNAESYEERYTLRQILRERKKKQGGVIGQPQVQKQRSYNRFAGGATISKRQSKLSLNGIPIETNITPPKQLSSVPPRPRSPTPPTKSLKILDVDEKADEDDAVEETEEVASEPAEDDAEAEPDEEEADEEEATVEETEGREEEEDGEISEDGEEDSN